MAIDTKHPEYVENEADWKLMRDSYKGERAIKEAKTLYLPMTYIQSLDYTGQAYNNYQKRAAYHNYVFLGVSSALGIMHRKPAVIDLPAKMERMRNHATPFGESMDALLRKINFEQLVTGRCGLLLDMFATPEKSGVLTPYIALYACERILNWGSVIGGETGLPELGFVTLKEDERELKDDFSWESVDKYRILTVENGVFTQTVHVKGEKETFESNTITPQLVGKTLNTIPFQIVNATNNPIDVESPPLLGLAMLCLTIYRTEADYRQAMFMTGQDTLVIRGTNPSDGDGDGDKILMGAGQMIGLRSYNSDAKMIGASGAGLSEQRIAIQYDISRAMTMAGQLFTSKTSDEASGDALKIRVTAQTATLVQVAQAGAIGLEAILKKAGKWMGLSEEEINQIKVTPNIDFVDDMLAARDLMEIVAAKANGLPISWKSVHDIMKKHEWTKMDFEEEMDLISEEAVLGGAVQGLQNLTGGAINVPDNSDSQDVADDNTVQ